MKEPAIPEDIRSELGIESLRFLRYSQNFVFSYEENGGAERILRVTPGSHRSRDEIVAELGWIAHLREKGVSVCAPLRGGEILSFQDEAGLECHCVGFERAAGRPVERADLGEGFYERHGRLLGSLHKFSADFPRGRLAGRKAWFEERYFTRDIEAYIPEEFRTGMRGRFADLREQVGVAADGALHFDLGYSNFFVDGESLWAFDFDMCAEGPFIADIAAALYSSIFIALRCEFPGDRSAFERPGSDRILTEVLPAFRRGYESQLPWPREDPERLQLWLDILYFRAVVHTWRILSPVTKDELRKALVSDLENVISGNTPVAVESTDGLLPEVGEHGVSLS